MSNCTLLKDLGEFIEQWNIEISEDQDIGKLHIYDLMEELESFYMKNKNKNNKPKKPVNPTITLKGCNECDNYYRYTTEGSFCVHPDIKKQTNKTRVYICNGFVSNDFPQWCPLRK